MTARDRLPQPRLAHDKFVSPSITARGDPRARVALRELTTLWFNTGTLCNLACTNCYIESSPRNDRLAYLTLQDVIRYLEEIERDRLPTRLIGFTGGEPFMNPALPQMLETVLSRGLDALVLTNAMKPMAKQAHALLALRERHGERLSIRVSIDHYGPAVHELERGRRSWAPTVAGLRWLARHRFRISVASRRLSAESEAKLREGFRALFASERIPIDADDPQSLVIFAEMDDERDVPEISDACWGILGKSPDDVMCSTSRMVVRRRGSDRPVVVACTLLPHDDRFELGSTLAQAATAVPLNHPHCATFCVLGGSACSR